MEKQIKSDGQGSKEGIITIHINKEDKIGMVSSNPEHHYTFEEILNALNLARIWVLQRKL